MNKKVHFSIDDCLPSLLYLTKHKDEVGSIFEMELYETLKQFYEKYGTIANMFLLEEKQQQNIISVCSKYSNEFFESRKWLRFGFHGSERLDNTDEGYITFTEAYENVIRSICSFASCENITNTIRLHRYQAAGDEIAYLADRGITCMLTAHDDRISYNLTGEESALVRTKGMLEKNSIKYVRTDLCVEAMSDELTELDCFCNCSGLVIFAHEWNFRNEIDKLDRIMKWLYENGYEFI